MALKKANAPPPPVPGAAQRIAAALRVAMLNRAMARIDPRRAAERGAAIAAEAYRNAERRGFGPGYELDDWLAAEEAVDARLDQNA